MGKRSKSQLNFLYQYVYQSVAELVERLAYFRLYLRQN